MAQEAFLRVWQRWDRVAPMERPEGYLYRTAMNVWRSRRVGPRSRCGGWAAETTRRGTVRPPGGVPVVEDRDSGDPRTGRPVGAAAGAFVLTEGLELSSEEAGGPWGSPLDRPGARRRARNRCGRCGIREQR
jgi:hypothetical protein